MDNTSSTSGERSFEIEINKIVHPDYKKLTQLNQNRLLNTDWKIASGAITIAILSNTLNIAKAVFPLGRAIVIWTNITMASFSFGAIVLAHKKLTPLINKTRHPFLRNIIEMGITVITAAASNFIALITAGKAMLLPAIYSGAAIGFVIFIAAKIVYLQIQHHYFSEEKIWGHFSDNCEIMGLKLPNTADQRKFVEQHVTLIGSTRTYLHENRILCSYEDLYVDITDHPICVNNKNKIIKFLEKRLQEVSKTNNYEKERLEKSMSTWSHISSDS